MGLSGEWEWMDVEWTLNAQNGFKINRIKAVNAFFAAGKDPTELRSMEAEEKQKIAEITILN